MLIDGKGKLFGKISILDCVIICVIIGIAITLIHRNSSKTTTMLMTTDTEFNIVLSVRGIRDYSVKAVKEGDIFYEQHAQILGETIDFTTEPARNVILKDDGTISSVFEEDRYDAYITIKCAGNVNPSGHYINGNRQVTVGDTILIQSNNILMHTTVHDIYGP